MAEDETTPESEAPALAEGTPAADPEAASTPEAAPAAKAEENPAAEAPAAKVEETPVAKAEEAPASESGVDIPPEGTAAPAAEGAPSPPEKRKDIFSEIDPKGEEEVKIVKAKGSKNISQGIVHVQATFNNTMVSVTDRTGNVIGWSSSGKLGFRGSRKSTAYASQLVSQDACRQAMSHGLKEVEVRVKGPGSGREAAVRAVQNLGIEVTVIRDVTPIPHNGCRPPKARRV